MTDKEKTASVSEETEKSARRSTATEPQPAEKRQSKSWFKRTKEFSTEEPTSRRYVNSAHSGEYDGPQGHVIKIWDKEGKQSARFLIKPNLCGPVARAIMATVSVILAGACLTAGGANVNECPIENLLPIWMIIFGVICALKSLQTIFDYVFKSPKNFSVVIFTALLQGTSYAAAVAWWIVGTVLVYTVSKRATMVDDGFHNTALRNGTSEKNFQSNYCSPIVFWISFGSCIIYFFMYVGIAVAAGFSIKWM